VHIGDDVALNVNATVQTHLFEDRVMKMSEIHIADRCSVGALSLVLYDTTMESGSSLGDLSLLMKNELLPSGTSWEGIPARPVDEPGFGQSAA
jgi:non-ribosomal peptide synthetase-like protein